MGKISKILLNKKITNLDEYIESHLSLCVWVCVCGAHVPGRRGMGTGWEDGVSGMESLLYCVSIFFFCFMYILCIMFNIKNKPTETSKKQKKYTIFPYMDKTPPKINNHYCLKKF